jgi:hypothetical protein
MNHCHHADDVTPCRYETNVEYNLRFMMDNNVVGCNWIELPAGKYSVRRPADMQSTCQVEVDIAYDAMISHDCEGTSPASLSLSLSVSVSVSLSLSLTHKQRPYLSLFRALPFLAPSLPLRAHTCTIARVRFSASRYLASLSLAHTHACLPSLAHIHMLAPPLSHTYTCLASLSHTYTCLALPACACSCRPTDLSFTVPSHPPWGTHPLYR